MNARSVLILEDNDIQFTNPESVFLALEVIRPEFPQWPDEIHMVSTFVKPTWWVHPLYIGDQDYYRLAGDFRPLIEFNPDELNDLTHR